MHFAVLICQFRFQHDIPIYVLALKMTWQQLSVVAEQSSVADVADLLNALGAVSVTYMDAQDQAVYEPAPGETRIWQYTQVIGLFPITSEPELIKAVVNQQLAQAELQQWQHEVIADQAWERSWMAHYQAMKFANRLWVCPTDQPQDEPGCVCLLLDPGLAFGTGTHATTALCLEWLAQHDLTGKTVIDYGCGSGILAIAAVLLGANHSYAIDIDPQAIIATRDNAEKNSVSDKVTALLVEDLANQPLPPSAIVITNILAGPLIDLRSQIVSLLQPGGHLILSGILQEQAEDVASAYRSSLQVSAPVIQEDWCRLDCVNS